MQLIDQHTKSIMEGCKERARDAGLSFEDESLEYIVTNRDLLELSPKNMIPTLYDYWVHDVEVLREKGRYELYPNNPFETVINTRPAISFYNDNNPDWLNVMIFYHVLGHIDFFQNNLFFRHTWDYDFSGSALADKRLIASLRARHGRWVDYVIEFARGIDNLVGYYDELSRIHQPQRSRTVSRLDFYFDVFLQRIKQVKPSVYLAEIERYNSCLDEGEQLCEESFFADTAKKYPEFETTYRKEHDIRPPESRDLLKYLLQNSEFLSRDENRWMKMVIEVVRKTSLYFQPQIRTKIMNEGWASYWHEKLFLQDDRIDGHEVPFARVHAGVTALPRVGLNPYALGLRLFSHLEEQADRGSLSWDYQRLADARRRQAFDHGDQQGHDFIFALRENGNDFLFINNYVDQDFVDRHRLFVSERVLDRSRMVWQYRVKSRRAEDYRQMLLDTLYHPPQLEISRSDETLRLGHKFEGKPLLRDFIDNVLLGVSFLWGGPVELESSEVVVSAPAADDQPQPLKWRRVRYRMEDRKLTTTEV